MVVRAKFRLPTLEPLRVLGERLGMPVFRPQRVTERIATEQLNGLRSEQASLLRLAEQLDSALVEPSVAASPQPVEMAPIEFIPIDALVPTNGHVPESSRGVPAPKPRLGLEGRRVAAIGFGRKGVASLAACMTEQKARVEFLPRGGYQDGEFDLLLINTGSNATFRKEHAYYTQLLRSGIPAIFMGGRSVFTAVRDIGGTHGWDFVPTPFHMGELAWRAVNLLARPSEGGIFHLPQPTGAARQDTLVRTAEESATEPEAAAQLDYVEECEAPTGDGPFRLLDPSRQGEYLEQFRHLRTQLMLHRGRFDDEQNFRIVCVMSTNKGEGKTFTASNLATVLAVAGTARVLLIDSDPEGPPMTPGLPLADGTGLVYALAEPVDWPRAVTRIKGTQLYIMARGDSRPGDHLDFGPLQALLDAMRPHFEWIVLDGAAFASCPDAQWLSASTDGTLLVVRENASSFGSVQASLASIHPEKLIGIVFNS